MKRLFGKIHLVFTLVALVFLVFTCGVFAAHFQWGPASAIRSQLSQYDQWQLKREMERKTTIADHRLAAPGYTLITSDDSASARLVDMNGQIRHEWVLPQIIQTAGAKPFIRRARLLAGGDIMMLYERPARAKPGVGGLVRLNRDSGVVWHYEGAFARSFDIAADGRIVVITRELDEKDYTEYPNIRAIHIRDEIRILSADGVEEQRIPIIDLFRQSPYRIYLNTRVRTENGDFTHTNSVEWLKEGTAFAAPMLKPGQILFSLRNSNFIGVVDVQSREIVWGVRGPWQWPYAPTMLANGNILLFDAKGHQDSGRYSRVMAYRPVTQEILWAYAGAKNQPFYSEKGGMAQALPNGNYLIVESLKGRTFEVDQTGQLVWNYQLPAKDNTPLQQQDSKAEKNAGKTAAITSAQRIPLEEASFIAPEPGKAP